MIDLSIREQRIIITKDVKFFQKKKGVPTYLLSKTDSNTGTPSTQPMPAPHSVTIPLPLLHFISLTEQAE